MSQVSRYWLGAAAAVCVVGALAHLAMPLGGPEWYLFFGAPPALAQMAEAGLVRPIVTCVAIAAFLLGMSAFSLSRLGYIRRIPGVRLGLFFFGVLLSVRAIAFPAIASYSPGALARVCGRCGELNAFVLVSSAVCLFIGVGFLLGVRSGRAQT